MAALRIGIPQAQLVVQRQHQRHLLGFITLHERLLEGLQITVLVGARNTADEIDVLFQIGQHAGRKLCLRRTEQVGLKEKLDVVGNAQRFDEPFDLRVFLLCHAGRTGIDGCEPLLHARQRRGVFRVAEALQLTDERREDVIADDSRSQLRSKQGGSDQFVDVGFGLLACDLVVDEASGQRVERRAVARQRKHGRQFGSDLDRSHLMLRLLAPVEILDVAVLSGDLVERIVREEAELPADRSVPFDPLDQRAEVLHVEPCSTSCGGRLRNGDLRRGAEAPRRAAGEETEGRTARAGAQEVFQSRRVALLLRILRLVAGEGIEIGRGEVERFAEAGLLHRPFGIIERRKRKERRAQYESRERPQFDLGHRLKHKKQFGPVERCGLVRFMLHRQQPQTDARHA